jgi:methanogenic corrinoid protein MtbC1
LIKDDLPFPSSMTELIPGFLDALDREDKETAVTLVTRSLEAGELGIVQLYEEVLAPAQNEWECEGDEGTCIWREHVRSSIVRTIVEIAYPHVLRERGARGITPNGVPVTVLCPPEELHEIGPRMVADYFTLAGYDVTFVGANTPIDTIISGVASTRPRYVAVSVTNHYNLVALRRTVERIRDRLPEGTEIIVGGRAIEANPDLVRELGADIALASFDDIVKLDGGV